MKKNKNMIVDCRIIIVFVLSVISINTVFTQTDTLNGRNLYRPGANKEAELDTVPEQEKVVEEINQDSIDARLQFIEDSIAARMQFIQDSILAREKFVRDSIQRRIEILDSLTFLRNELPRLLEAALKNFSDDVIIFNNKVQIVGDSTLSNYTSLVLPFTIDQPYTPWKSIINLSDRPIKITIDTIAEQITAIKARGISCTFSNTGRKNIIRINGKSSITSKYGNKLYKVPVDSIWFNKQGKVLKIKQYFQYYEVKDNYQRGSFLFNHLSQVKQFEYASPYHLTNYRITNFCDRQKKQDPRKVCNNMNYSIVKQGNSYLLTRVTDPINNFADGKFSYEFDHEMILQSVAFENNKKTENWKTIVEVNEAGNVSRYIYQNKGAVHKTLLVNYYLNDPGAKNKVETITCLFEDDGVSYYQVNNTTGKTRERNKLTMEWSAWR